MDSKTKIEYILKSLNIPYEKEYKFLQNRKFKFDWAFPDEKIAIEYEGIFSKKSRHTGVIGYSKDTTKYNLAVIDGWKVLRYTALNTSELLNDIKELMNL
jgi:hypothetical protein